MLAILQHLLELRAHLDVVLGHDLPDALLVVALVGARRGRIVQKDLPPLRRGLLTALPLPHIDPVDDIIGHIKEQKLVRPYCRRWNEFHWRCQ